MPTVNPPFAIICDKTGRIGIVKNTIILQKHLDEGAEIILAEPEKRDRDELFIDVVLATIVWMKERLNKQISQIS